MNAYDLRCSWCDRRFGDRQELSFHEKEEHGMFDGPDETKIDKPYGPGLNVTVPSAPKMTTDPMFNGGDDKPIETEQQLRRQAAKQEGEIALDPFRAKYRKLTDMEQLHLDEMKRTATTLYHLLDGRLDVGGEFFEAKRKLEECVMWSVKGFTA